MINRNKEKPAETDFLGQDAEPEKNGKKPILTKKNKIVLFSVFAVLVAALLYGRNVEMPSTSETSENTDVLPPPTENELSKALPTDKQVASDKSTIGQTMKNQRDVEFQEAKETGDVFMDSLISQTESKPISFDSIEEPKMKEAPTKLKRSEYNPNIAQKTVPDENAANPDNQISIDSSTRLQSIIQSLGTTDTNLYETALKKNTDNQKAKPSIVSFADPKEYGDYDSNGGYKVVKNGQVTSDGDGSDQALFKVALGSRYYGSPEIMLVSDDKGPAVIRIYEGPLKGAVLAGSYSLNDLAEGINISLDRMSFNGRKYNIDAKVLDLKSGRPVVSDDVNHHYLERYGSLGLAVMASGFADTLRGTTQVVGENGNVTVVEEPISKTKDRFIYALGQVGSAWSQELTKNMSRPITVYKFVDTGVQVLFMDEVEIF